MAQQLFRILRHRNPGFENIADLDTYIDKCNGFATFKKVVTTMTPKQVIDVVKASGLRGRGGAGFPTGVKWSFLTPNKFPRYVVCNSDESEPGTFKDREIMESNPFQFLEGLMIACYAAEANLGYNYCRGEFWELAHVLEEKIAQLRQRGLLGDNLFGTNYSLDLHCHLGAGAYICGEESALLESLEGKLGQPRLKPPFPADTGLYGKPTVVNNTETLTNVPLILEHGADWYREAGTKDSPGTKVICISGHAKNPDNYEVPLGTTFREVLFELAGGIRGDKKLKAILPSGASAPILMATDAVLDTPLTYEDVRTKGSELGSASMILMDETTDMSWVAYKAIQFFKHESCGKCTPCREGNYWMLHVLKRVNSGKAVDADIELVDNIAKNMRGKCLCPLGEFAINPVISSVSQFREDYKKHVVKAK